MLGWLLLLLRLTKRIFFLQWDYPYMHHLKESVLFSVRKHFPFFICSIVAPRVWIWKKPESGFHILMMMFIVHLLVFIWYFSCWLVAIDRFQAWGGLFMLRIWDLLSLHELKMILKTWEKSKHEKWKGRLSIEILNKTSQLGSGT